MREPDHPNTVPVSAFIAEALSIYYANKSPIGKNGDYITAPEICQVFGELIALWCLDSLQKQSFSQPVRLIELGAGTGTLLADVHRTFERFPDILGSYTTHIIDCCPALIEKQKKRFEKDKNVSWHHDFSTIPPGFSIIIANEFFDALPVGQYIAANNQWHERLISIEDGILQYHVGNAIEGLDIPIPYEGAIHEKSPESVEWMQTICTHLKTHGGIGLVIDYGEACYPWIGDTLQALYQHKKVPIFSNVGQADITHHVDFTALKIQAESLGITCGNIIPQGEFLKSLGIEERVFQLAKNADHDVGTRLLLAATRLISPREMGILFKVLELKAPS